MFTGLIETIGTIEKLTRKAQSLELTIAAGKKEFVTDVGASISVSGICLTVESTQANRFSVRAVSETLERSTLATLRVGEHVNLERALLASGRFEGHIVLGHVDGVGKITADKARGECRERTFEFPRALAKFFAEKGSVAIDGISLTIVNAEAAAVTVALIPHTLAHTTMEHKRPGDAVNCEVDVLARYLDALRKNSPLQQDSEPPFSNALESFLS